MKLRKARRVQGMQIALRNAQVSDAEFILSLRVNPALNTHISAVSGELSDQIAFLERYTARDGEAFFVIEDAESRPLGTIRLYDQQGDSFCWGSWIVRPDAPPRTGTKSALLLYMYGFEHLGFLRSHFDVRQQNERVWQFHEKCGARLVRETEQDRYYVLQRDDWNRMKVHYQPLIGNEPVIVDEIG